MLRFKVTGLNEYKVGDGQWAKQVTLTEDGTPDGENPVTLSFVVQGRDSARAEQFQRDGEFTLTPATATSKSSK